MQNYTTASQLGNNSSGHHYLLTVAITLLVTFLFFRSILPRLPRLLFRGRLRVQRLGLRGARGIEWRSEGFSRERTLSTGVFNDHQSISTEEEKEEDVDTIKGMTVKVRRIWLHFHSTKRSDTIHRERYSGEPSKLSANEGRLSKAWVTLRIEGVGVTLPKSEAAKVVDTAERKMQKRKEQRKRDEEMEERAKQAEMDRLDFLMQSRPSSPVLGSTSSARQSRSVSPMPAFTTAMTQLESSNSIEDKSQKFGASKLPRHFLSKMSHYIRITIIPALWVSVLTALRTLLYLFTSALPFLSSIIDVEINRVEVYHKQAEAVIRVDNIRLDLSMSLIASSKDKDGNNKPHLMETSDGRSFSQRFSDTLASMPNRLGSHAKGAASFVTDGLPAGRISLRLTTTGVQVLEATLARRQEKATARLESIHATREEILPQDHSFDSQPIHFSPQPDNHAHSSWNTSSADPSTGTSTFIRRSTSFMNLNSFASSNSDIGFRGWTDWALENDPNSSFSPQTGWRRKSDQGKGHVIHPSARVFSMPEITSFRLSLILTGTSSVSSKESIHIAIDLSEATIGLDALIKILKSMEKQKPMMNGPAPSEDGDKGTRSQMSKHFKQQKPAAQAIFLEQLGSASFHWPGLKLIMSHKSKFSSLNLGDESHKNGIQLPSSLQVKAEIKDISLSINTSDPDDEVHQRWLGTCGIKGYRPSKDAKGFTDRFRWNPYHQKVKYVEHRRAFQVEAGLGVVDVVAGVDGESTSIQSELLHLENLSMKIRSTWTPVGMLVSAKEDTQSSARKFFQGDPNEQSAIIDVSLSKLVGDLKTRHATAIIAFVQKEMIQRKRDVKELGLIEKPPKRPHGFLESIPRIHIGVHLSDLSYRLDASELLPINHLDQVLKKPELGLIFAVPSITFAFHANYVDEYVKRGELERKAAWKSLHNDELEWSLKDDTLSKIRRQQRELENSMSPRPARGDYASWQEHPDEEDLDGEEEKEEESGNEDQTKKKPEYTEPQVMTIKEAILKMKEIQRLEALQNQPDRRRALDVKNKWKKFAEKKEKLHHICPYNTRLKFESQCTIKSIELFWAMTGSGDSSRRRTEDDTFTETTAAIRTSSNDLVKHHVICLQSFELGPIGSLPGFQDVNTSAVRLDKSKAAIDLRMSLEEVDLDMWHPAALDATRKLLQAFHQKNPATKPEKEEMHKEENDFKEITPNVVTDDNVKPALIEAFKSGLSAYVSIGSIVCHIASIDDRCDIRMSRGLGFEAKRIVLEAACFEKGHRRAADRLKLALGARSTLDLPEDMRSSCGALATRYGKGAMMRLNLFAIGLFPLLDAEQASAQHLKRYDIDEEKEAAAAAKRAEEEQWAELASPSIIAPEIWEFQKTRPSHSGKKRVSPKYRQQDRNHFILWLPFSSISISIIPKVLIHEKVGSQDEQLSIIVEGTRLISLKIELLHTYCMLMAFATIKGLFPEKSKFKPNPQNGAAKKENLKNPSRYQPITHHMSIKVDEIHILFSLPDNVNLFVYLRRLDCHDSPSKGPSLGWETLMGAVESAIKPSKGLWDEMLRIRDCRISTEAPHDGIRRKIIIHGDGARLSVPFGYTIHPIINSTVVSVKATKQLMHQFLKGTKHSVIHPTAEGPKHLPIIQFKLRIFSMEAQDDPFETRLNIIWRAGGDEHQARAERDAAFREKVNQLEKMVPLSKVHSTASTIDSYTETISSDSSSDEDSDETKNGSIAQTISTDQARQALDAFNASSWIRRCRNAKEEQARREEANRRKIYGRLKHTLLENDLPITVAEPSMTAPLFRSTMTKFDLEIGPNTFPESDLPDFLYEQGHGLPRDSQYSIFVPMHLRLTMAEWKLTLRDYPLPLLHLPPTNATSQPDHLPAWEMNGDMCIAEQMGEVSAIRHITAIVVPAATGRPDAIEYGIAVPRMSMPTKFFGSPIIKINSCYPTRLVWGQSIQPAIHDLARVLESVTSPPHDPSPRIGFWDKLSLLFHGKVHFKFAEEGELHLYLKGSRDPYHILEHGAGWVKCWRGNVEMKLGFENDERELFQILSDEYLLAIPDLKDYIDRAATGTENSEAKREDSQSSDDYSTKKTPSLSSPRKRYMKKPEYKKICMKLADGVRWGSGLHLERTCTDKNCIQEVKCKGEPFHRECRFWDRKPHWEVYMRSHEYAATIPKEEFGDSYEGWRTHHLHFSISLYSRKQDLRLDIKRDSKNEPKWKAVNNLWFTPLAWEHFFAWTRLFNSALSLPIRQGHLFPGSLAQSPKFGRHLATIKYRFDISPLFITHVYPQHEKADWARGITTLLGVKSRISTFHFDLHQRQQEMLKDRPALGETRKVFHKPFFEAEVDLAEIDLRTLAGQFIEPEKQLYTPDDYENDSHQAQHDVIFGNDAECTKIPERDKEWYDVGDFVELDWMPPFDGIPPKIRLMQAMTCPRFNYYRHIETQRERKDRTGEKDNSTSTNGDEKDGEKGMNDEHDEDSDGLMTLEKSKFGREETHPCLVGKAPTTVEVQIGLADDRIKFLTEELHRLMEEDPDSSVVEHSCEEDKSTSTEHDIHIKKEAAKAIDIVKSEHSHEKVDVIAKDLQKKIRLIEEYVKMLRNVMQSDTFGAGEGVEQDEAGKAAQTYFSTPYRGGISNSLNYKALYHEWEAFDNRYFAHNPTIFVSNATRDVLLKYYLSSRRRRGLVHSLSARAVRYIRNLTRPLDSDEKQASHRGDDHHHQGHHHNYSSHSNHKNDASDEKSKHDDQDAEEQMSGEAKSSDASRRTSLEDEMNTDGPELLRGLLRDTMQYIITDDADGQAAEMQYVNTFDQEEVDPTFGISDEYEVRKSNVCVLLKPQIVLRSLIDDKSTMILTAIRSRMHNYSVKDPTVEEDSVNERALYRNYVAIDGLQSFHPSEHCSFRQRAKERYGFLHVPLETLIDLKYETKDFDRIAPRTDASMHYDKFNKLRMHDSSRPVAANIDSDDPAIDHLRHNMDLIRLRCPKFAVLANSEHFGAIYNIVTDLLLYRDPTYREYAKRLEMMMLSYDLSDFDTLASIVQALQIRIRHAKELHVQYHLHFQHLNEQGRFDFLSLKAELKDTIDELSLLMDAIKVKDDQSGSDKDKKSAIRVEAQANDIAWNMMGHEEGELLAKLTIKGASFTWLNKADNSAANTLSITDLNAVNVHPDAVFTEIITKYNNVENHPMKQRGVLLNAIWSVLAPVGGISIIDHLEIGLHPLSIQLEKSIGRRLEDYIFGSKREREKKNREQKKLEEELQKELNGKSGKRSAFKRIASAMKGSRDSHGSNKDSNHHDDNEEKKVKARKSLPVQRATSMSERSGDGKDLKRIITPMDKRRSELIGTSNKSLSTRSSMSDLKSNKSSNSPQQSGGQGSIAGDDGQSGESDSDETGQHAIAARNALEMRSRASRNTTFVYAKVFETIFCLSYKGEKQKSITDLYDLVFRAPRLEYRNRTWAHADLLNHLKKDILKAAWRQKSTLLKGVINHRRPRRQAVADNIRALRDVQLTRRMISSGSASFTALQNNSTLSDSSGKIQEIGKEGEAVEDDQESTMGIVRKEVLRSLEVGPDENKMKKEQPPPFKFSIDPPDSKLSGGSKKNEDLLGLTKQSSGRRVESSGEENSSKEQDEVTFAAEDGDEDEEAEEGNRGGTRKLGKYLAKKLTGNKGKRSNSHSDLSGKGPSPSSSTEIAKARAARGEREGTMDTDSEDDIGHDDTPDHSSEEEEDDDDDNDDDDGSSSEDDDAHSDDDEKNHQGGSEIDSRHNSSPEAILQRRGGQMITDSPQSGRSLLSVGKSRISTPSPSQSPPPEISSSRRASNSNQGKIGSGIKAATSSLPKIHTPWQFRKESGATKAEDR